MGDDGKKASIKFVKGGRLYLYPSGTNLYRYSRGIQKPEPQKMAYYEAKQIIGAKSPDFSRTVTILGNEHDKSERVYNHITYEYYNLKRKPDDI